MTSSPPAGHPANSGRNTDINPASAVARNGVFQRDFVAVRYAGGDLTFGALDDRSARLASVLEDEGTGAGDRVAFLGLNSTSFLVVMLASFRMGAIFVPVNFRLSGPELHRVLDLSGSSVIVCEPGHLKVLEQVRGSLPLKRFLLVDDDPECPAQHIEAPWEGWTTLIDRAAPRKAIAARGFDEAAVLMFTSGTTGTPKGVTLTYGNMWWNSVNVDTRLDTRRGDVTHAAAPIFHIGALNSFVLRSLVRGGTVVLRRSFEPPGMLEDLVAERVNSMFGVPAMFAAMGRLPGFFDADLSHLRSIVVAAAPVPPSLIREYAEHGVYLQQAWGLTETAPFATHLPIELTLDKVGSAGIAMPYTEIGVVDEHNLPVEARVAGEIVVRGPNVTPGYWNNPEATAAAFDDEGWFHSGDIGYVDEDGCLFIVDRLKDMIISGGENIYPAEVESALADMAGLTDVAVIGVADETWGETVLAMVSIQEGSEITLDDVRAHAQSRLARYKLPTQLRVIEIVPRNASGKLDKFALRSMVEGS